MIDNKKIEEAAKQHSEESYISGYFQACYKDAFMEGAKWIQEEFLKDLWHPTSEEPKNLEYIVFTTTMFGEVYLFTKQVDNTQDWKTIVETHGIEQWIYRNDIVSLIFKEVKE